MGSARELADELVASHDPTWVAELIDALATHARASELATSQAILGATDAELGQMFGVTRQGIKQWMTNGVPTARLAAVADLAAASDILRRKLRIERIPAAIRRPAPNLGNRSLLQLGIAEGPRAFYDEVVDTFDLTRIAG